MGSLLISLSLPACGQGAPGDTHRHGQDATRPGTTAVRVRASGLAFTRPWPARYEMSLLLERDAARPYEARGWFRRDEPGALLEASYDPNYTGTFIELKIGEPPVFLQLPAGMLGEAASRLPLPASPRANSGP